MSFGFGVGDFLAVSRLALDVYTAYKDAPQDFRNISDEIKSLHIITDSHKDELQDKTLSADDERRSREILQGCLNVLGDLDELRDKYMGLGLAQGSSSQALDRIFFFIFLKSIRRWSLRQCDGYVPSAYKHWYLHGTTK